MRYFYDAFDSAGILDTTNLLTYSDYASIRYHNALIGETHTFSSTLVLNNFILSYQLENSGRGPVAGAPNVNDLGVNVWQPAFKQINQIQAIGFFTVGDNPAATFRRDNYTLADDVNWVKGRHTLGFGFHGEISKVDVDNQFQQPGIFQFNSNSTVPNALARLPIGRSHYVPAGFGPILQQPIQGHWLLRARLLEGNAAAYPQLRDPLGTIPAGGRKEGPSRHVQCGCAGSWSDFDDASHRSRRLAVPWRYRICPQHGPCRRTRTSCRVLVLPMTSSATAKPAFAAERVSSMTLACRAWPTTFSPTPCHIVASVNVTYGAASLGDFSNPYANIPGGNIFPAPQPPPASFFTTANYQNSSFSTFDPTTFRVPVTYSYNLTVEQQFANTLTGRLAYVGSQSFHQINPTDINPTYNQGPNIGKRVYFSATNVQNYTNQIATTDTGGLGNYHSLQASLQKRVSTGSDRIPELHVVQDYRQQRVWRSGDDGCRRR